MPIQSTEPQVLEEGTMPSRRLTTAVVALVIGSLLLSTGTVAADQEQLCGDVQLIHARGTGVELPRFRGR